MERMHVENNRDHGREQAPASLNRTAFAGGR
jgi:hypothetical protein